MRFTQYTPMHRLVVVVYTNSRYTSFQYALHTSLNKLFMLPDDLIFSGRGGVALSSVSLPSGLGSNDSDADRDLPPRPTFSMNKSAHDESCTDPLD